MESTLKELEIENNVDELIERELFEETLMIREIFKNSTVSLLIFDKSFRIVFVTESFAKMIGFSAFELVGEEITKILQEKPNSEEMTELEFGTGFSSSVKKIMLETGEVKEVLFYTNIIKELGRLYFSSLVVQVNT